MMKILKSSNDINYNDVAGKEREREREGGRGGSEIQNDIIWNLCWDFIFLYLCIVYIFIYVYCLGCMRAEILSLEYEEYTWCRQKSAISKQLLAAVPFFKNSQLRELRPLYTCIVLNSCRLGCHTVMHLRTAVMGGFAAKNPHNIFYEKLMF